MMAAAYPQQKYQQSEPRIMPSQFQQQNQFNSQQHQAPPFQQPPPFMNQQQQQQQTQQQQQPPQAQQQSPQLSLRIILSRVEAEYLFGFDGVLMNQLRQQTGANITITDPNSPEQILILSGTLELIFKAFSLICRKLWDCLQEVSGPGTQRPLIIRLAVHNSQCGSIIGKQGAKVKEIRDLTGANIQVSQDSLPDSSERTVEISGTGEACLQCTYHICVVLQDSPMRGEFVPFVPKPVIGLSANSQDFKPVFLCGDKAYVIEGNVALPAPPELLQRELAKTSLGEMSESLASLKNNSHQGNQHHQQEQVPPHVNPVVLMQAISSAKQGNKGNATHTSKEMVINHEMVGFIIGKGGSKITEIRRISGAQLHINQDEDTPLEADRVITISGTEECILLAQFLIQSNIDIAMRERGESASEENSNLSNQSNGGGRFGGGSGGNNNSNNTNRGGTFRSGGFRGGARRGPRR